MKINRRTFLKAAAIATLIPTLPAIAKQEQQWIPLEEQFPKKGQHVIILDVWDRMRTYLQAGQVNSIHPCLKYDGNYLGKCFLLSTDFIFSRNDYKGPLNGRYNLILNNNSANYSFDEIINTPWIKADVVTHMFMGLVPFYKNSNSQQWWIPALDRIPQKLPPLPANKPGGEIK